MGVPRPLVLRRKGDPHESKGAGAKRGARNECSAFSSLAAHYTMLLVQRMFIQGMGMRCSASDLPEQDEVCWNKL